MLGAFASNTSSPASPNREWVHWGVSHCATGQSTVPDPDHLHFGISFLAPPPAPGRNLFMKALSVPLCIHQSVVAFNQRKGAIKYLVNF